MLTFRASVAKVCSPDFEQVWRYESPPILIATSERKNPMEAFRLSRLILSARTSEESSSRVTPVYNEVP